MQDIACSMKGIGGSIIGINFLLNEIDQVFGGGGVSRQL
jgi:hypothetical protein